MTILCDCAVEFIKTFCSRQIGLVSLFTACLLYLQEYF